MIGRRSKGRIIMCLAIPMQIRSVAGSVARCEARGIERDVSLLMLQDGSVGPGDFVLVHVGYAIQAIAPQEAQSAWQLLDDVPGAAPA